MQTYSIDKLYLTNKGDWVRSKYEQAVANFLHANQIEYVYEKELIMPGLKPQKPDFYLPAYNGYIEVLGVFGNKRYNYITHLKKETFKKNGIKVIYLHHSGGWRNEIWKWFLKKGFQEVLGVSFPEKKSYVNSRRHYSYNYQRLNTFKDHDKNEYQESKSMPGFFAKPIAPAIMIFTLFVLAFFINS